MGWRRFVVTAVAALGLLASGATSAAADEGGTVISFQSMTPITGSAVGSTERGLTAGGLAWKITSASGSVDRDGHVSASVMGLVLNDVRAGALNGTNPIHTFAAVVTCRTTAQQIAKVQTIGVPASTTGNATIVDTVALPHPCTTPEVFVGGLIGTAPNQVFRWFAVSNGDFADAT